VSDKTTSQTNPKKRPFDEVQCGRVKVVVWKNTVDGGAEVFNFVPTKIYKEGEVWRETASLGVGDLLPMTEALREAYRRVMLTEKAP
jgi:hypothetical protein